MPRDFHRSRRVEEQIQRLLVDLIRREVKDPRVGPITITAVEVSRDLSHAKVHFLPFDAGRDAAVVAAALGSAAGFLRLNLKKQLAMRQVPELHFVVDETIEKATRLSSLINAAVASDTARAAIRRPPDSDDSDGSQPADETS
jgi:ribosome-binding factor A